MPITQCPVCGYRPRRAPVLPFTCVCGTKHTTGVWAAGPQPARTPAPPPFNLWRWWYTWLVDTAVPWVPAEAKAKYETEFVPRIPNAGCGCSRHWAEILATTPPIDWSDRWACFASFNAKHNIVSTTHANRPAVPLAQALGIWQGPRIGWVADAYLPAGGTETFHRTLLPRLRDYRNIVGFVAAHHTGGDGNLLGVPYATGPEAVTELAAKVDILVSWGMLGIAVHLPPTNTPKLINVHHGDSNSGWSAQLAALPQVSTNVAINPAVAASLAATSPVPVHYIPNAVDPLRLKPRVGKRRLLAAVGIPADSKVVLWGHRMTSEKQPLLAVAMAQHLPPGWVLVMAGAGSMEPEVVAAAQGMQNIRLVGALGHLGDWLQVASAFVSMATMEGFGLAVAEAAAAGVPVVSTPTGCAATVPGLAAVTVPATASPATWAGAVVAAAAGGYTPPPVLELFSVDKMVAAWATLLE